MKFISISNIAFIIQFISQYIFIQINFETRVSGEVRNTSFLIETMTFYVLIKL